ncbi:MAG: hypothetical protein WAP47_16100, partial [Candidatus Rokuibacteriota bacterium]
MTKRPFAEQFEFGGLRVTRVGPSISIENTRTPEEHQAFLDHVRKTRPELRARITQKVEELKHLLQELDPLDVIANVAFSQVFINPEKYKEYEHEGRQAYVEYVTLACLSSPYHEGTRLLGKAEFEPLLRTIEEIFTGTLWYYGTEFATRAREEPDPLDDLRFKTRLNELFVRNPGYSHHLEEVLQKLFSFRPIAEWMMRTLGFGIEDIFACAKGIATLMETRLHERRDIARATEREVRGELRAYKRTGKAEGKLPAETLERLAPLKERHARREIRHIVIAWTFLALGDTLSFTPDELASIVALPSDRVRAVLETFSLAFSEVDAAVLDPAPITHPLQRKPLVRHEDRYLCPAPTMVLWAVRPLLESLLNPGGGDARDTTQALWEAYQQARGGLLVREGINYLARALRRAQSDVELSYTMTQGGVEKTYDLDGLVLFDTIALLVEGKAGGLSPAARRGAPSLLEDLRQLVTEPHVQALRARDFIAAQVEPRFRRSDGTEIVFDKSRYRTLILVSLTLEPLDAFTTATQQIQDLGIFADDTLPWNVQILDLRVISELTEFPSQLVHYLKRRLRLHEIGKLEAHDELDWFGHYLRHGLYFEDQASSTGPTRIGLQSYTTEMDSYYLYVTGDRTSPVPMPRQPMPDLIRRILQELEDHDGEGYVMVSTSLLELGWKERKQVAKYFDIIRSRSARDGKIHDFTLIFSEGRSP